MIIVLKLDARPKDVAAVEERLAEFGFRTQIIRGEQRLVIGAVGDKKVADSLGLEVMPGVERVIPIMKPFKMVTREARPEGSRIRVKNACIGGGNLTVIAGPCAVESRDQLLRAARAVQKAGAHILRGGAFKPRTSPYSFQGLEEVGLKMLAEAAAETGMGTVTEVVDEYSLDIALHYVDMVQIGARNMQNFRLLRQVGRVDKPVLLKRGQSATIEEWLMAAEYIVAEGNERVVLCERGIRTFENYTRNTLDISAVPAVKRLSHLPIMVDPSHATGDREMVAPLARAAVAAGADGLMIEVHPEPERALCDGPQSLDPDAFARLMEDLKVLAMALGRVA